MAILAISKSLQIIKMDRKTYFHLLITGQLADELEEPDEFTFIRMLKKQEEKRNGRRRKNNRNYPRGRRKAV